MPPRSTWVACVQTPLPSVKIGEGEGGSVGGLYTGSTWEPVRKLTEKVPLYITTILENIEKHAILTLKEALCSIVHN